MANCNTCGRDVGCGCNLLDGKCTGCYNNSMHISVSGSTTTRNLEEGAPYDPNGFETILNNTTLSQEEKLRRINDILENARPKTA